MTIAGYIRNEAIELWGHGKGKSLAVVAICWSLLLGTRMIYPVLLPDLRTEFGLTLTTSGLLVTILWLGSAVGQLPGGVLADRHSERKVMVASVFIVSMALVFVVTAPTAVVLFAATGFIGLGQSLYPIARITILKDIYPDRVGSALGVTMASGDLGQTLLPPVAGALAVMVAWQAGLGFVAPLLVIAGISMWLVLPVQTSTGNAADSFTADTVRYVLRELYQPDTAFMTFIIFLYLFIWQSFTGFYPTYLVEVKRLSPSMASIVFSLYFAAGVVVKPLSGLAYDQIGVRRSLILIFVSPFVGFLLLPVVEGFWSLAVVTVLVSTILGSGAITQSHLANSLSDDMRGTGLGVIRTTTAALGATGPVLFGIVAERGYFSEGYTVMAVLVLILVIFALRLPRA